MAVDGEAGAVGALKMSLLEQQLDAIERPRSARKPAWPWILVVVGALLTIGLSLHGYTAYTTLDRINQNAKIPTGNPVVLFQNVATNGPRIDASVDSASRPTYTRALNQFALDGTGLLLGITLLVAGVFIRLNW